MSDAFEKWASSPVGDNGLTLRDTFAYPGEVCDGFDAGSQSRQPEIDELKEQVRVMREALELIAAPGQSRFNSADRVEIAKEALAQGERR